MSIRALVIWILAAAVVVGGTLVMHGHGHRMLAKWMPALHGQR